MNAIILTIIVFMKQPIYADYSALTEEVESSHRTPYIKVGGRVRIITYKNNFSKGYTIKTSQKIPQKLLLGHKKIEDLNGGK